MSASTELKTKHLLIRPLSGAELAAFAGREGASGVYSRQLEALNGNTENGLWYTVWSVSPADNPEEPIGAMHFDGPPQRGCVQFSCEIFPEYRGRGLAGEAADPLLKWAFHQPGVCTVQAEAEDDYDRKLLGELGFAAAAGDESGCLYEKEKPASAGLPILMCVGLVVGLIVGFTWKGRLWMGVAGVLAFAVLGVLVDAKDRLVRKRIREGR